MLLHATSSRMLTTVTMATAAPGNSLSIIQLFVLPGIMGHVLQKMSSEDAFLPVAANKDRRIWYDVIFHSHESAVPDSGNDTPPAGEDGMIFSLLHSLQPAGNKTRDSSCETISIIWMCFKSEQQTNHKCITWRASRCAPDKPAGIFPEDTSPHTLWNQPWNKIIVEAS